MITEKGFHMLAKFHGLDPANSTDEHVQNCINNAVTAEDLSDLQNRAAAGDEARKAQVENDLKHYANRIGTKKEALEYWATALYDNRAGAVAALEAMAVVDTKAGKGAPLHDPNKAGQPKPLDNRTEGDKSQQAKKQTLISNRAAKLQSESNMPPGMAWVRASEEIEAETAA
jgi:hypothetical protein